MCKELVEFATGMESGMKNCVGLCLAGRKQFVELMGQTPRLIQLTF